MSRITMSIEEEFSGKVIGSFDLTEYADRVYNQALEDFFTKCLDENIQFYLNPIDCMREVKEQLKK